MSRLLPEIVEPSVPADEEAEKLLIGTLLSLGNEPLDRGRTVWDYVRTVEGYAGGELFNLLRLRPIWEIIRRRAKAGLDFQSTIIGSDNEGRVALEAMGPGWETFPSGNLVSPFALPEIVDRVSRASSARTAHKVLSDSMEMLRNHPEQAPVITRCASKALVNIGTVQTDFPAPVRLEEWMSKPLPHRPEIVRGLLRKGDKLTIGGSSKSHKTWLVSDLALCVSVGKPWMGFQTVKSRIVFLNLELPEDTFQKRIEMLCGASGVRLEEAEFFVCNLRGHRASIERIDEYLQQWSGEIGLLVLDPLYKLLGDRKENDAADMAELMGQLEAIATRHGCALVIPAHYSKGNQSEKEAIDRISGSGVFARDADAIVSLTAHEQPGCFAVEFTLRSFAPIDPFAIRWGFPLFRRDDTVDPKKLKRVAGRKPKVPDEELLALLGDSGKTWKEWQVAAREQLSIPGSTFKDRVRNLRESGKVRQLDGGTTYTRMPK
ncbi:MAG: AAA family ATPase [Verrucomicrobiales bacterium]|nr:AAA family ATPase [Verrucomicrobiales bacterium]